ncbi:sugar ABC transporter ATP-binding protein [Herbiconiux moechotypicola]|uniref:Sugar ABC transporter ATP-binding protein n=1 Tax=Herbiconiux moechotypicola TaxID=637393 RepID=A0ABP5Q8T1_9MICO|nr:sugar ABC transporter ATP-binding protein [Herbiconiux moechotypicola]MCS5729153.1 sugar ABC transporter ATP-binding protein [Herbiconiux moechotypicola]
MTQVTTLAPPPASSGAPHGAPSRIRVRGIVKEYGVTRALRGVDLDVAAGEIHGLVGHNGAGKSTLMRILTGIEQPTSGTVEFDGDGAATAATSARPGDVRMAYQELSLAPDLTVAENASLSDARRLRPLRWRAQAERRIAEVLDTVFPGHGIELSRYVGELSMAERQVVEISRALCSDEPRLLILDEPTESLGVDAMRQMYAHLHVLAARGVSILLISHRMNEVLEHSDRISVLKDGATVLTADAGDVTEDDLLVAMGGDVRGDSPRVHDVPVVGDAVAGSGERPAAGETVATASLAGASLPFEAKAGEIVGLAGLAGQGQDELLDRLWFNGLSRRITVPRRRAYVPGDRQTSGVFALWTVADNLAVAAARQLARAGFVSLKARRTLADRWVGTLSIKGGASAPITSLSGGNQQKVLIARAFATDAPLVLLNDPFRGVDVATKDELYTLMKAEAAQGRCIVWYSTENKEVAHCDRVYVFRAGRIVSELVGDEISEERVIAESFDEHQDARDARDATTKDAGAAA